MPIRSWQLIEVRMNLGVSHMALPDVLVGSGSQLYWVFNPGGWLDNHPPSRLLATVLLLVG